MIAPRERLGLEIVIVGLVITLGAVAWDVSYILAQPEEGHGHMESAAHVSHHPAATVLVVLGIVLAGFGSRMRLFAGPSKRETYLLFGATTLLFADGIVHLYVVSEHLTVPAYAVFFAAAAALQLGLGFALFFPRRFPSRFLLCVVGILVTIGLIALYFVSRTVTLPFASGPEEYDAVGVVSKVLEVATLGALGSLVYGWRIEARSGASAAPGP